MLSFAMNIAIYPWGSGLTRITGYATILLSYVLPFIAMRKDLRATLREEGKAAFVLCLVLLISVVINLNNPTLNVDYFRDVFAFFCMYWTLALPSRSYSRRDLKDIFLINKFLSLVFIVYTLGPFSFKYTINALWGYSEFTLGMGNPNGTALNVMFCIALLVIEIAYENRWYKKLVLLFGVAILTKVVVLLASRTVLVCSCLIISMIWLRRFPIKKWYVDVSIAVMFIFVIVQMWMESQSGILILGKTIASGRQEMYRDFLESVFEKPWKYVIGAIDDYRLTNAHNAPLAILLNLGILGLGAFCTFWRTMLRTNMVNSDGSVVQKVAIVVLCAYVIYSSTEAGPMLGMILYSTPLVVLSRLAKDQFVD